MADRKYIQKPFSVFYDFDDDTGAVGFIPLGPEIAANATPINASFVISTVFTSGGAPTIAFGTAADVVTNTAFVVAQPIGNVITFTIGDKIELQAPFGMTIAGAAIITGAGVFYMNYIQLEGTD